MTSKGVSFAGPVAVLPSLLFGVLVAGGSPLAAQERLTHERMIETLRLGVVVYEGPDEASICGGECYAVTWSVLGGASTPQEF